MKRVFKTGLSFIAVLSLLTLMGCPADEGTTDPETVTVTWNGDGANSKIGPVDGTQVTPTQAEQDAISALVFTFKDDGTYTMQNPSNAVLPEGINGVNSGKFTQDGAKIVFTSAAGVVAGNPLTGNFTLSFQKEVTTTVSRQVNTQYTYAFVKK